MSKMKCHCKAITVAPSVAVTGIQLKYQYLADFLVFVGDVRQSAAWGLAPIKGGVIST